MALVFVDGKALTSESPLEHGPTCSLEVHTGFDGKFYAGYGDVCFIAVLSVHVWPKLLDGCSYSDILFTVFCMCYNESACCVKHAAVVSWVTDSLELVAMEVPDISCVSVGDYDLLDIECASCDTVNGHGRKHPEFRNDRKRKGN